MKKLSKINAVLMSLHYTTQYRKIFLKRREEYLKDQIPTTKRGIIKIIHLFFKKLSKINAVLISHRYTLVCLLKILFLKTVLVFLDRIEVFSPEIASIGYDDAEMLLQVEFHNLCIYNFFDVPRDTYERCVCSDNIEGYFQTNIENYFESDRIL